MADFYDGKKPLQSDGEAEPAPAEEAKSGAEPERDYAEEKLERVTVERLFGEDNGGNVPEKKRRGGIFSEVFDCFETFCYALVLMMLLFVFVFRFVSVNGSSMTDTLHDKDKLIISNVLYTPSTGDIVVLDAQGMFGEDRYIIKRIIATGGQKVEIDFADWTVKVDGSVLEEEYVKRVPENMNSQAWISNDLHVTRKYDEGGSLTASFTVPKGKLFVMGDNRNGSSDSREKGFFNADSVLGRVLLRIGPKSSFGRVG